jgi:ATP-dependent DNA helicase RecG
VAQAPSSRRVPRAASPITLGFDTPVGASGVPGASVLRRVGPRLAVRTVRDLLFYLPRRYEDLRELRTAAALREVEEGSVATARLELATLRVEQTFRRRVQRTTAVLRDATGEVEAAWFGRRFIERRLKEGDWVVVSGRIRHRGFAVTFDNPEFQRDDGSAMLHAGRIVPVYRLTAGLTARTLRGAIRAALDRYGPYREYLPEVTAANGLTDIGEAVEQAHYPDGFAQRDRALERLAFDELLALQIGMVSRRRQRAVAVTEPLSVGATHHDALRESIRSAVSGKVGRRVELTGDQLAAMTAIGADMAAPEPMLRLLQGDVGSGKTAVAAYGLGIAAAAGAQGALLAPTDLLARQHAVTLASLLEAVGVPVTLLTGSLSGAGSRAALEALANGQAQCVVGTHALIQERVSFARLGMVVIDEQHRFGVEQRGQLEAKAGGRAPHVLLMTATPIPRTLGQILYADLDVTDLRTSPADRIPIRTGIKEPDALEGTWQRVRDESAAGHRTFVVVPLIDEAEGEDASAAEKTAMTLREQLAPLRVGLVHGRLKAADRDAEMARFRDGQLDVLVGTTVVEVGVDVPEATMMIVLDADRFGLAQLHQLRGRVGRGTAESFCVLVSSAPAGSVARARLEAVQRTRDGFALAEADFELRREGDVLGLVQSGLPALRVASLQDPRHRELATLARATAESLVDGEGSLPESEERLRAELERGWLSRIAAGEPASGA